MEEKKLTLKQQNEVRLMQIEENILALHKRLSEVEIYLKEENTTIDVTSLVSLSELEYAIKKL